MMATPRTAYVEKLLWLLIVAVVSAVISFTVTKHRQKRQQETLDVLMAAHASESLSPAADALTACVDTRITRLRKTNSFDGVQADFTHCKKAVYAAARSLKLQSDDDAFAVFATVLLHRLAPYGASAAETDTQILHAEALHCGITTPLLARLIKSNYPDAKIEMWNLYNPLLTNHGILNVKTKTAEWLLDTSTATVAKLDAQAVLTGVPVQYRNIVDFAEIDNPVLKNLRYRLRGALMHGGLRTGDLKTVQHY